MSTAPVDSNGDGTRSSNKNLAEATLASATSLMGLQLLSRLVTFGLNQGLIRIASPQVFGTASIQLELLLNTILFLSREGIRNAFLRAKSDHVEMGNDSKTTNNESDGESERLRAANLALIPFYSGFSISFITALLYHHHSSAATKAQPYFDLAVVLYVAAAVIELFSEPMHIRCVV